MLDGDVNPQACLKKIRTSAGVWLKAGDISRWFLPASISLEKWRRMLLSPDLLLTAKYLFSLRLVLLQIPASEGSAGIFGRFCG